MSKPGGRSCTRPRRCHPEGEFCYVGDDDDDDDDDDGDDDDDDKQIESNRNFIFKNSKFRSDVSLICKEYICGKSKLCQKIEFSFRRKSIFSPWP